MEVKFNEFSNSVKLVQNYNQTLTSDLSKIT